MRKCDIQEFVKKNEARIVRARQKQAARAQEAGCKTLTAEEIAQLKEKARNFIPARVKYFSEQMGLFPSAVKISSAVRRLSLIHIFSANAFGTSSRWPSPMNTAFVFEESSITISRCTNALYEPCLLYTSRSLPGSDRRAH